MFDVHWTNPDTEKVGERKARKEREQDFHGGQDGQDARLAKRHSTSTRRSSSSAEKSTMTKSTGDKAASLFGSFGLKKNRLSSKSKISHASDLRIPIPEANTVTPSLPTASTFGSTFSSSDFLGENSPESQVNLMNYQLEPLNRSWVQLDESPVISGRDTVLATTTPGTSPPPFQSRKADLAGDLTLQQSKDHVVQSLGRDSWITQTTETLVEVKSETGVDCARPTTSSSSTRVPADPHTPSHPRTLDRDLSVPSLPAVMYDASPLAHVGRKTASRPQGTIRSKKTPRSFLRKPTTNPTAKPLYKFVAHDPTCWKAPMEWEVEEKMPKVQGFNLEEQFSAVKRLGNDSLADIASVQREIKKMPLLVPASILFRLEEKLSDQPHPSAYKETELERRRLMLFALGALGSPSESQTPTKRATKILALFESEATASYLAAVRPESSITHLAPSPLSAMLFPNVRPLVSPIVSNTSLSVAPNYFSHVYCLPLPSIMASQDIPGLLRNVYTCLLPGGILHLILIDPAPATSSLGPRMRQWMENNLLLNLERQFRCTNPRRLVPLWLADVGFRSDEHMTKTVKYQAVFQKDQKDQKNEMKDSKLGDEEEDILNLLYGGEESRHREQQAKLELQSRIGRLLWQETWGGYVNAKRWWWDDAECIEECGRLGTYWEYNIVEAFKESN
ncbi:hypothetical protein GE09DRAFT_781453 [Coniochaeta sp. 2T2.1]|nr:hypothetical protein GE09DRAFT_781453 [Coniochaeta sp. 2T2.1]